MIFLGWNQPLLHATADWLLDSANIPASPDLSNILVVVRGRRAGRRLLELLTLKCAEQRLILVPPEIVTPAQLVTRLTRHPPEEPRTATPLASALAWAEAIRDVDEADRAKLFRRPGSEDATPSLRALLGLGKHLNQLWSEIGGAGLAFRDVIRVLEERFPHVADFEVPRWEVLESLHQAAGEILLNHGLIDSTDLQLNRARWADVLPGKRVVLVGVVEIPRSVRDFLIRLPESPTALVFAPESEREGFDDLGILRPGYWDKRNAGLDAGQIHLVERDRDQALRLAHLVKSWHDSGVALDQMTVAVPDAAALPRLREALETEQFKTRWAQGRPTSDAPAFQLLKLVAEYLDHGPDEPPRYEAVAALARYPDLPGIAPFDWSALDRFATKHLPARFDPGEVNEPSEQVRKIQAALEHHIHLPAAEISPRDMGDWTLRFLHRIYGERQENSLSPEGRVAVHAMEAIRDILSETAQDRLPWPAPLRPADFLQVILGFLGEQPVPEPADGDAVQIVGWLELIEDDAPAVAVASFHEGAVPESISSDPFLPGSLRQALSLSDNAMRFARDAYALATILGSRSQGRGIVALLAPRFDPEENPVRPSRLLLAGLEGEALARRVWHLAGRREPEPQLELRPGTGFSGAAIEDQPAIEHVRVTAFRDYLESPRKFYFQHILGLRSEDDAALELEASGVGTLIHEVMAVFGTNPQIRDSADEAVIQRYILDEFERIIRERFGRWVQPAVEIQVEEVRRRLGGFGRAQAALRRDGWEVRFVEGNARLECALAPEGEAASLQITGKIDRIDFRPATQKWRIIDYKTAAKGRDPLPEHRKRNGDWRDLQLPLYLKLATPYAKAEWNVDLTPDNCELTYFLLPEEEGRAGISEPFPPEMIEEAWAQAGKIAGQILRGEFTENPELNPERNEPALLALCGQVGITSPEPALSPINKA